MPNLEPVVAEGRGYTLRHIGPKAIIWPNPPISIPTFAVLGQPFMIARPLPMTNNPNSSDMVSGSWTGRLNDAGEFTLTFPNKEASDGQPWRNRFAGDGHLQWIEIWNDEYLESCCFIEKPDLKRDQVVISGHDGWFALKGAYERDWVVVQAPRDVIERGTQLWVPVVVDNFPSGNLNTQWVPTVTGGSTVTINTTDGATFTVPGSQSAKITSRTIPVVTQIWSATCFLQIANIDTNVANLNIIESSGTNYSLQIGSGIALFTGGAISQQITLQTATSYSLLLESDGEWLWAYVNGQFVGGIRRVDVSTTTLVTEVKLNATSGSATSMVLTEVFTEAQQSFLQRGTDKGDYVLPGDASTYPSGGLHGRYFNNADLQSDAQVPSKIHHPSRTIAFTGGGGSEYANRQDPTINFAAAFQVTPGAAGSYYSTIWFGAIYLRLSLGNYGITFQADDGVRLWIGKTKWGDQLIDVWNSSTTTNVTLSATSLGSRDGWYPIKIEWWQGGGALAAKFSFTPPNTYTDPGGTALTGGALVIVPATSLSPLGCVDQRYQGISHFDLVQKTGAAFDYQLAVEPKQLESGLFPGVLVPRLREGQDTDAILEPDDRPRAEGLLNYGNTLDSTDICTSIQGNGAGFQSGNGGQLQARVFDPTHIRNALFDIQGWQDFSDAAFASLLQAQLNSQLGLRLDPWQIVTGDPIGRVRLANTWPLPSSLVQQRWRPGDGMRVQARDVNVFDAVPRQILLLMRQIHPNGSVGVQVSFAARPRSAEQQLKQTMFAATRWQRNYQGQFVTLTGSYIDANSLGPGAASLNSFVSLSLSDLLVRAYVRIAYNLSSAPLNVLVNGVDVTTILNGPWTVVPLNLDITAVASPDVNNRLFVGFKNTSGGITSLVSFQLYADVHGR